jgi:hypothetical protein
MINKINKERRLSMNATPTRPSNKNQWQGVQNDPKHRAGQKAQLHYDKVQLHENKTKSSVPNI